MRDDDGRIGQCATRVHQIVKLMMLLGIYPLLLSTSTVAYFIGSRDSQRRGSNSMVLRRIGTASFCDMRGCPSLASWQIGYGTQSICFCARHTVRTMKDESLWTGQRAT